jgi:[acyl-carrier-protein] S-malonyltransferase
LSKILKNNKKKSIFLPVSAPFHSSLMKPASEKMEDKINATNFKNPSIHLVSNVTASSIHDSEQIKNLLIKQIFSKVSLRAYFNEFINTVFYHI